MNRSPFVRIAFPSTDLDRFSQTFTVQVSIFTAEPFIFGILAHVLDDIRAYVIDLINAIDFYEATAPNLLQFRFLDVRQIANHVVVNGTTTVFILKLNDRDIEQFRVTVFQAKNEAAEILIA